MSYRFEIMTNQPAFLEEQAEQFNQEHGTDLAMIEIKDGEVLFVEMETSMSEELLFQFGIQFGLRERQIIVENFF